MDKSTGVQCDQTVVAEKSASLKDYPAKLRHLAHHRFENCNYGVTTGFWDIVFRTHAGVIGERIRSGTG